MFNESKSIAHEEIAEEIGKTESKNEVSIPQEFLVYITAILENWSERVACGVMELSVHY